MINFIKHIQTTAIFSFIFIVSNDSYSQDLHQNLNTFLEQIDSSGLLMGSLSISKNDKAIYNYAMGSRNVADNKENSYQTVYRIGSVSKSFTSVIIMQLIEEQKLSLNTTIDEFVPTVPNSKIITIQQLLKHQSGLFNITLSKDFFTWMLSFHSREEIIDLIVNNGTVFKPGQKTKYSNTNYILLSIIAEMIEDKTYSKILNQRIVKPCNLQNTWYGGTIDSTKNEAFPYSYLNPNWISTTMTNMSVPIGAGAIVSNPSDLNLFYYHLLNGDLVNQKSLALMTTPNIYEYALYPVVSYNSKKCFGHEGRIDGFHTFSAYFPADSVGFSFNSNGENVNLKSVFLEVISIYFSKHYDLNENTEIYENNALSVKLLKFSNDIILNKNGYSYFLTFDKKNKYSTYDASISIKFGKNGVLSFKQNGQSNMLKLVK